MGQDIYGDSEKSQAFVLTALALAVIKVNVNAFSFFSTFTSDLQEEATNLGVKLLRGELKPEKYVTDFEKIAIKAIDEDKRKEVEFDDYTKEQIKMRIAPSFGQEARVNRNKLKEERKLVAKKLTNQGYIKKYENSDGTNSYYRSNIKIDKEEYERIRASHSSKDKLEEAVDYTPQILTFLQANPHSSYNAILAALGIDPKSGKAIPAYTATKKALESGQIQREKAGKAFVYSLKGTAAAPQPAATAQPQQTASPAPTQVPVKAKTDYKPQILAFIKSNPKATAGQVLQHLGVAAGTALQIPVYKAMQDLLVIGAIARSKEGKLFQYSIGDGTPVALTPKVKKPKSMDQILQVVNANWNYRGRTDNDMSGKWESYGGGSIYFDTTDRGPRTDHGGPPDGDGWMTQSQIARVAKPYEQKWMPRLKELIKTLKKNKIVAERPYVDYGEKGHIALQLQIKQ